MRKLLLFVACFVVEFSAQAVLVEFGTDGTSTGDNLDNVKNSGTTVAVAEIDGLNLTATFGAAGGSVDYLNAIVARLGVNSDLSSEGTSLFDTGEWMGISFSKEVNVTLFKFTDFTEGDSVKITWKDTSVTLVDADLNGSNEYSVNWDVATSDTILLEALGKSTTGGFGFERMDLSVVPEPTAVAMIGLGGVLMLVIRRFVG